MSIITVTKNDDVGLRRTIESVLRQDFNDWELLIVFAGSYASVNQHILMYAPDSRIKFLKEISKGIYPAMNQGINSSSAEFLWFLNSGDVFVNSSCLTSSFNYQKKYDSDLIIGGYQYFVEKKFYTFVKSEKKINIENLNLNIRSACHQSMLFRKDVIIRNLCFDEKFKLASDFKLILQICNFGKTFRVSEIFAEIQPGGVSDLQIQEVLREKQEIRKELFSNFDLKTLSGLIMNYLIKMKLVFRKFLKIR